MPWLRALTDRNPTLPSNHPSVVTVWVLLTVLFSAIVFAFFSTALQGRTIFAVISAAGTLLVNRLSAAVFACCVARGNHIRRPRLLLALDLVYTVTLGAAAGLTAGFVRFVLGVVWLMFKMTLLSRPILPNAAAAFDSGFVAHAGMMKAAFAARLDRGSSPTEPDA